MRLPDTNINGGGPLPTTLSGSTGINGDPDGQYNFNSDLLSGVTPYSFGQGRMGSDRSYQQVPHRMQKIIPKLYLPYADFKHNNELLGLSHAVDQGDVAFVLQSDRVQTLLFDSVQIRDASVYKMQIPNRSAFVNISTVNYLLAGLQRIESSEKSTSTWVTLADDLGYDFRRCNDKKVYRTQMLKLISTRMLPFGICAGSEKQGGQNETGLAPVQAAANHVSTLTVDGQNRDLVNFWRHTDLSAGDQLIYVLRWVPTHHYTLNHYYKGTVRQTFTVRKNCWQLIPEKFSMNADPPDAPGQPWHYDYRVHGYWRIGQTFQHRGKYESLSVDFANDMTFMRGQLLQVTFAPVWMQYQEICEHGDITAHLSSAAARVAQTGQVVPREPGTRKRMRDWFVQDPTDTDSGGSVLPEKVQQFLAPRVPKSMVRWKVSTAGVNQNTGMLAIRGMFTTAAPAAAPALVEVATIAPARAEVIPAGPQTLPEVASMHTLQAMLESVATPAQLDVMQLDAGSAAIAAEPVGVTATTADPVPVPEAPRPKVRVHKPKKVPNAD